MNNHVRIEQNNTPAVVILLKYVLEQQAYDSASYPSPHWSPGPGPSGFGLPVARTDKEFLGELQTRFDGLVQQWKSRNKFSSDAIAICLHPAYQTIISMGLVAVPMILRELEREFDHWFFALTTLTNFDPTDPSDHGDLSKLRAAWLDWGARTNLL